MHKGTLFSFSFSSRLNKLLCDSRLGQMPMSQCFAASFEVGKSLASFGSFYLDQENVSGSLVSYLRSACNTQAVDGITIHLFKFVFFTSQDLI